MTPNEAVYNNTDVSAKTLAPTYPAGSYGFELLDVPTIFGSTPVATINGTTGVLTFVSNLTLFPGTYEFIVRYYAPTILWQSIVFRLVIINYGKLNRKVFNLPKVKETPTLIQLVNENETASGFSKTSGDTNFTISSSGLITFTHDGEGAKFMTISYSLAGRTLSDIILVNLIEVDEVVYSDYDECPADAILITWLNDRGGWDTYYFTQNKRYQVSQAGAKKFVNNNRNLIYSSRGSIYDVIEVNNQLIPKEHVEKIASLRNAIQAYKVDFVDDEFVFTSITIDEGNFITIDNDEEFKSLSFRFIFSQNKLVQIQ